MKRLATLALALAVSACKPAPQAPPAAPPPAPAPGPAAGPLTYEKKTPSAEISLSLPARVGQLPALYARLFAENRNTLDQFAEGAVGEVTELRSAGLPAQAYVRDVDYAVRAETPRLLSLSASDYENTGGAHPNGTLRALTWDKTTGRTVALADLFAPGADLASANKALCDALAIAKKERTGQVEYTGDFTACPPLKGLEAALAPSTTAGKAGGLTVLFSPYQVGPYAEGTYEIAVPQAAFRAALAPLYAGEFDGVPAPVTKKE